MIKRPEYFANRPAPAGSNRITPIDLEVLQGILHRPGRIDLGGVVKDNIHPGNQVGGPLEPPIRQTESEIKSCRHILDDRPECVYSE